MFLLKQDSFVKNMIRKDNKTSSKENEDMKFIKETLQKPCDQRSDFALDKLAPLIMQVKFFKDKSSLTKSDIRDLASQLKFESHRCQDSVIEYGDI